MLLPKPKRVASKARGRAKRVLKFDVLITTFESIYAAGALSHLGKNSGIDWSLVVVDEAQKLKQPTTKLFRALKQDYCWQDCLLLTGTPIQVAFIEYSMQYVLE